MDLQHVGASLKETFGENNVKPYAKGFRIIIEYENTPYCVVLRVEENKLLMEKDAIDQNEANYDEAYRKAYKMLLHNKERFNDYIEI